MLVTLAAALAFLALAAAFGVPLVTGITHLAGRLPGYIGSAQDGRGWIGHLLARYHVSTAMSLGSTRWMATPARARLTTVFQVGQLGVRQPPHGGDQVLRDAGERGLFGLTGQPCRRCIGVEAGLPRGRLKAVEFRRRAPFGMGEGAEQSGGVPAVGLDKVRELVTGGPAVPGRPQEVRGERQVTGSCPAFAHHAGQWTMRRASSGGQPRWTSRATWCQSRRSA